MRKAGPAGEPGHIEITGAEVLSYRVFDFSKTSRAAGSTALDSTAERPLAGIRKIAEAAKVVVAAVYLAFTDKE